MSVNVTIVTEKIYISTVKLYKTYLHLTRACNVVELKWSEI